MTARMLAWKQPLIQRVRNSSLVERSSANNNRALSILPKLWIVRKDSGRRAFLFQQRRTVMCAVETGKENVGMSNDNPGEKPGHQKTQVS